MTTDNALATIRLDERKKELIKNTICRGGTDEELQLFYHACERMGLDPLMKQIYAVKRWDSGLKKECMAIQIGIDGYRILAERSGRYAPGREATFTYQNGSTVPFSATAYVRKQTQDGTWHEVSATAFYDEYVAKTKEGRPTSMWGSKPHIMLAKCAESLALRRAFPGDLSGIYCENEMEQAGEAEEIEVVATPTISDMQYHYLMETIDGNQEFLQRVYKGFSIEDLRQLPSKQFERVLTEARKLKPQEDNREFE
jgi:phage recombination protein Bet